jgi:C4-dicarboxylate-specific signal transduction histidine kinase
MTAAAGREDELRVLREELAVESRLATLGELARPVVHEFNNFLNLLLLQMAVLEMDLPERLRADLAEVRRQGNAAATLIRAFQRYRQEALLPAPADVGQVLDQAVTLLRALHGPVAVDVRLAPSLPPVQASAPELRRLCLLLLTNAAAVVDPARGSLILRAEPAGDRVLIRFEDNGPPLPAEQLPEPFDPHSAAREGSNALELAACRSIARRLRGGLSAENLPGGGAAFVLDLAVAS